MGAIAHIGDTIHRLGEPVEALAGFQPAKAMVCIFVIIIELSPTDVAVGF